MNIKVTSCNDCVFAIDEDNGKEYCVLGEYLIKPVGHIPSDGTISKYCPLKKCDLTIKLEQP